MIVERIPLPKHKKNTPEIKAYIKAVQEGEKMYFLSPFEGKWIVKNDLPGKGTKIFDNKNEAIAFGINAAKNDKTELIIFDSNGRIKDRMAYDQ